MSRKYLQKIPPDTLERWKLHDNYDLSSSVNRTVTRSQTSVHQVLLYPSTLWLFVDPNTPVVCDQHDALQILKGKHGNVPRTIITRSTGQYIGVSPSMEEKISLYKKVVSRK